MKKDNVTDMEAYVLRTAPGASAGERARQLAADQAAEREDLAARRRGIRDRQMLLHEIQKKRLREGDTGHKVDHNRDFLLLGLRGGIQELRYPSNEPREGRLLQFPKKS